MKSKRACQPIMRRPLPGESRTSPCFGWKFPNMGGRQEVHHRLVAWLDANQLRDFHLCASAHTPLCHFPQFFCDRLLLVFLLAAVAKEMFPCLGRVATATFTPAFVIDTVSDPFLVHAHCPVAGLQSVEPGFQRLHAVHWDGSLAPSFACQPVALMFAAFVSLPLSIPCRLCC
jgi:hypothetical protein